MTLCIPVTPSGLLLQADKKKRNSKENPKHTGRQQHWRPSVQTGTRASDLSCEQAASTCHTLGTTVQNIVVVVLRGSFYKCCSITTTASAASAPYLGPSIGQFNFRAAVTLKVVEARWSCTTRPGKENGIQVTCKTLMSNGLGGGGGGDGLLFQ